LFKANDKLDSISNEDYSWNVWCKKLNTICVPGNHYSLVRPPYVEKLAMAVSTCLFTNITHDETILQN
jgi:thioesterase domain-containing protein